MKRKRKHTVRLIACTNGSANATSDLQQHLRLVFDDISVLMLSEKGRGLASISLADGETHWKDVVDILASRCRSFERAFSRLGGRCGRVGKILTSEALINRVTGVRCMMSSTRSTIMMIKMTTTTVFEVPWEVPMMTEQTKNITGMRNKIENTLQRLIN